MRKSSVKLAARQAVSGALPPRFRLPPSSLFVVCRQQTIVWWEQTMVWRQHTIVWWEQTKRCGGRCGT
ncbi:hypothetical protein [Alloprevotella tannerae]|uniref:hypothetical protein n=1 Tax=Alloprevotella tannerae TaxID=76122 RepID=UPI00288BB903|nr:hypothetical protein [Alloprevotella tannerae]